MSYCTVEDVIKMSGVKPNRLGNQFKKKEGDTDDPFEDVIEEWISQAEGLINGYCKRNWNPIVDVETGTTIEVQVPIAVKNVCIRLVANIIAFRYSRKENPIKKVNDYSMTIFSSEIFTDDLKEDLKPFKKSSRVSVFKI
jgi:hypothetical protein